MEITKKIHLQFNIKFARLNVAIRWKENWTNNQSRIEETWIFAPMLAAKLLSQGY